MKKKVPSEVREHFLDDWVKIKTPRVLVEKLDEYEDVHGKTKRPAVPFFNKEKPYRRTMPLDTRGPPSQVEDRNKEGMANRRYVNHFTENSHQAHYNQHRITPKCYTCGKEGHFARACQDKSINKQNSPKNKFPSPVKAQSNVVQAEEDIKNIVTAKMDTPGSMCNFLAENIDRLKTLKVKCLNVVLDGTVDSGTQISVVRTDLVKDIESTGEGKIKLISAFGDSETAPLRTFSIRIDDGWHDAVPITCAVSKKLVNDMLVCQTAYEALLGNIQLCSVNAGHVIDDDTQLKENKSSIVCEVQTFEKNSGLDIEVSTDRGNIGNEVRSNLSSETRLKVEVEDRPKAYEEVKAVVEGRKMEEERRMNKIIALEEEMRLKNEKWLVEGQMRHVQEEHETSMKKQKWLPEERCKRMNEQNQLLRYPYTFKTSFSSNFSIF
ncbi:retrovirus-related Pol polyprotein from transposon opus [Trichonephila clavipes]|nr:retrovirus-related Pol polyprotein from transposon opus [Trichonephila clavipes]